MSQLITAAKWRMNSFQPGFRSLVFLLITHAIMHHAPFQKETQSSTLQIFHELHLVGFEVGEQCIGDLPNPVVLGFN